MNGHAQMLLTKLLRVDGTSPLVRVDTDDIIRAAADLCTEPMGKNQVRHEGCGGAWTFARGCPVPGRPGTVFGRASCTRCPAQRDAVIGPGGEPHGGPVYHPMTDR